MASSTVPPQETAIVAEVFVGASRRMSVARRRFVPPSFSAIVPPLVNASLVLKFADGVRSVVENCEIPSVMQRFKPAPTANVVRFSDEMLVPDVDFPVLSGATLIDR